MLGTKQEALEYFSALAVAEIQKNGYSLFAPENCSYKYANVPSDIQGCKLGEIRAFYNATENRRAYVRYIIREDYAKGTIGFWKVVYFAKANRWGSYHFDAPAVAKELESFTTYRGIICTEQERAAYELKHQRRQAARELHPKPIITKRRALAYLQTKKGCSRLSASQLLDVTKCKVFRHKGGTREGLSYVFVLDKPKNYRVAAYYGCLNPSSLSHYWEKSLYGTVQVSGFTTETR